MERAVSRYFKNYLLLVLVLPLIPGSVLSQSGGDFQWKPAAHVDDPAAQFIEEWRDDTTRTGITIRQLATHSSGGWKTRFWKREPDPFTIARDWTPMKFRPGTGFEYSNPGMAMLSYAVTSALQDSEHRDIRTLLRERVMMPIGVPDSDWSIGYGETYAVDGLDLVANWGGGGYTARAVARVGRLMPEPWGPWTTTYVTEDWGLGATHGYRLPGKWIDPKDNSAVLIFSGRSNSKPNYDAFCLRKMYFHK